MTETNEVFHAGFKVEVLEAKEKEGKGHVRALVSAYNVDYLMGYKTKHRMLEGAFADSLAQSANVPVFWQHNWSWSEQPPIGTAAGSEENSGLVVEADFFLDTEAGRSVYNAIAAKALREWSIGYRITKYSIEDADDGTEIVHIERAELLEASSVLRGANPQTDTLLVAGAEGGLKGLLDQINAKVEQLEQAQEALALAQAAIEHKATEGLLEAAEDSEAVRVRLADLEDVVFNEAGENGTQDGGEGVQVEPTVSQDGAVEGKPSTAAGTPAVPDFLPPSEGESDPDDIHSVLRVARAWNKSERQAQVRSLISNR